MWDLRTTKGFFNRSRLGLSGRLLQSVRGAAIVGTLAGCVVVCAVQPANAEDVAQEVTAEASPPKKVKPTKTPIDGIPGGDPRGVPDLTVCSQNLKLFGTYPLLKKRKPGYRKDEHTKKIVELTDRFVSAKCDVIAVQEVLGKTVEEGEAALQELSQQLRSMTNRFFDVRVGPAAEGSMTTGFLVAQDRATILSTLSYARVELPRINKKQKPRLFSRTPLEIQLRVGAREGELTKTVSVVNFHFKSKRGGQDDPTGLEWETYRMEMAEALRKIIEIRHKSSFAAGESLLLVVGDRNGNFDVASARILDGSLALSSFDTNGPCRMSKRGVPLCQAESALPRRLFSVLTTNQGVQTLPGTFSYKGEYSWLDDILMPAESLRYAWRTSASEGEYSSGVVYEPKDASDHALVYVRLNW